MFLFPFLNKALKVDRRHLQMDCLPQLSQPSLSIMGHMTRGQVLSWLPCCSLQGEVTSCEYLRGSNTIFVCLFYVHLFLLKYEVHSEKYTACKCTVYCNQRPEQATANYENPEYPLCSFLVSNHSWRVTTVVLFKTID